MVATEEQNQLGKRYRCEECGSEVMCMTRGEGRFACHGAPMRVVELEALPASD
jgi:DNA-directed RNA polymerase subunit RPC12/RpoP